MRLMLILMEKKPVESDNSGEIAGIAFVGKLVWGYTPTAGETGRRMWKVGHMKQAEGARTEGHYSGPW